MTIELFEQIDKWRDELNAERKLGLGSTRLEKKAEVLFQDCKQRIEELEADKATLVKTYNQLFDKYQELEAKHTGEQQ